MRQPPRSIADEAQTGSLDDPHVSGGASLLEGQFRRSSVAFYLRTAVLLTEEDLQVSRSRTLLGLVPLWRSRRSFPVDYLEGVSAVKRVSIGGLVLGFLLASVGLLATLTGSVMVQLGAVAIALGVFSVLRSPQQAIVVSQAVGGPRTYAVAITERGHIARFAQEASSTLDELHKRRGPVDLSEPLRRWRRRALIKRLAALGIVVVLVAAAVGGYRAYQDSDVGFWLEQQLIAANSRGGHWDLPAPSGRPIATIDPNESANTLTVVNFPHVQPIEFPGWGYQRVGVDAYPSGFGNPDQATLAVSGYLVAKEKQGDGSHLFGVEVPYLDGSLISAAAGSTKPSCKTTKTENTVGGVIVWLRIFPATDTTWWPMETITTYGDAAFAGNPAHEEGMGPNVLYEYIKVGDPVRAGVNLAYDFNAPQATKDLGTLVKYRHASNATDARAQIEAAFGKNMKAWQAMSADCGRAVPLVDQLQGKRYVLSPLNVAFLPLATR